MIALLMDYYTTQGISVMNTKHRKEKTKHRLLGSTKTGIWSIYLVQTIPPIIKITINEIGINL